MIPVAQSISEGDIIILKSTSTKGSKHDQPFMRIKAVGIVTSNITTYKTDSSTMCQCTVRYVSTEEKDFDGAMKYIDKALELDSNKSEFWNNKGRLIYNKAFMLEQESFDLTGKELALKEKEFVDLYQQSIPYFQKAIELNPDDYESLKTLKSLYYRLYSQFHLNQYQELYNQLSN